MTVHVEGPNAIALRKELKKMRTRSDRMSWKTLKKGNAYLCTVLEPTEEEERRMLYFGELR